MNTENGDGSNDERAAWEVGYTDRADADIEEAYRFLVPRVEAGKAEAWLRGLYFACENLADFPGPFACVVDETASERLGQEVRRFVYRGPKGQGRLRRIEVIGAPYRVYFYTIGVEAIFIVRVLHGAAGPWPDADDEEAHE